MRDLREILRQKLLLGRSHRQAARAVGISVGSVASAATRAQLLKLDWKAVEELDDEELDTRMYGPRSTKRNGRAEPDVAHIHVELRRPGVTLQLLHLEYLEQHPEGFRYTVFCERYKQWLSEQRLSMRQTHTAGDKEFVDYSGKKPSIVDAQTGEVIAVELFVAVLGASSYTYAEATYTQQLPDWLASNTRALEFFSGVSNAVVPDQLKSAVTIPCKYDPGIQRTYDEYAEWKCVVLNVDYHAGFDGHYYSAPHRLRGEELWLRATASTIEIFRLGRCEAVHARSRVVGQHTTVPEHMPVAHREHAEWTPERILGWAATVGANTHRFAERLLTERSHPEHGYRSCLGVFRLAKKYGADRVEAACARALLVGARSYRHVASILQHGLDRAPVLDVESRGPSLTHENVRGPEYYH